MSMSVRIFGTEHTTDGKDLKIVSETIEIRTFSKSPAIAICL